MRIMHALGSNGLLTHDPERHGLAGIGNAVMGISVAQLSRGHTVSVSGYSAPKPSGRGVWRGVPIHTLRSWKWAQINRRIDLSIFLPMFFYLLKKPKPDVLHVHEFGLLRLPKGLIRVLHLHMHLGSELCSSSLWKRADGVICCSQYLRKRFLSTCDYPTDRVFVVHNGAEPNATMSVDESDSIRRHLAIEPSDLMILFAGAIVRDKGLHILLEALEMVASDFNKDFCKLKLVVMGSRSLWRAGESSMAAMIYEKEMYTRGEGLNARFVGSLPHSQAQRLFAACDLVVVPSVVPEVHPLVVCEAMAAAKPIIASRVGGIPETVLEGENALLFPMGDSKALAEAIRRVTEDQGLLSRMGTASLLRSRLFTWESAAQKLDAIYHRLLEAEKSS